METTSNALSRRDFLARVAVAGAGLIGCRESTGSLPDPPLDKTALEHIVIVTMENRSFDHLLGWLPGADGKQPGLTFPDKAGARRSTRHLEDFQECRFADPDHSFGGGRTQYNYGSCDGWLKAGTDDEYPLGYYEESDLPFVGRAARGWTVLDKYFAPFLGPTFPNRIISQAGQTDRLSNTLVPSALPTIWDRLSAAGLSGANYGSSSLVTASLFGNRYASLIKPFASFLSDAAAGTVPNVAYVDPDLTSDLTNSYHPPGDIRNGEAFLAGIYKAVTTGPLWKSTVLIITFDEWGGFFDHVPPPAAPLPDGEKAAGNDGLRGFRVPILLISPFARRGRISSTVYDHASILKLIEWRWGLAPLTVRDAGANNLGDELDFTIPVAAASVIDVNPGPYGGPCV